MFGNGAGIPTPTTARTATTVAAAGTATTPASARWAARTGAGAAPMTPTTSWASVLSALLAKNSELWLWSTGVAQAASRSGAGTEQLQRAGGVVKKRQIPASSAGMTYK